MDGMRDYSAFPATEGPVVIERAGGGTGSDPGEPSVITPLRHLARESARTLQAGRASIWVLDAQGKSPVRLVSYRREEDRLEESRGFEDELGTHTAGLLASLSVLAMEDVEQGVPPARPLRVYLQEEGVRALLAIPIRRGKHVRGFLSFEEFASPRLWGQDDRERAQTLAREAERILAPFLDREERGPLPTPSNGPMNVQATAADPAPDPRSYRAGGERELRARLARLRGMEGSGILAADLAHELLHLLEVQDGYLELLEPALEDRPEDAPLLTEAREAGARAWDRVFGFLRWARDGISVLQPLELNAFLGEMGTQLGKLTGENVSLVLVPSFRKVPIRGHRELLGRAVDELVRNARRISSEGGKVRIQIQRGEGPDGREMGKIIVEDEGKGISASDLPWIFEPFYSRREGVRSSGDDSSEVGLALVQAVVEGHGGWVDLSSVEGRGTRVTLTLPLLPAEDPSRETEEVEDRDPARVQRPQILLLEDDAFLGRLLRRALERAGMDVLPAESVSEAERILTRSGGRISLILAEMEIQDGGQGMSLVRAARRSRPDLPAVLLHRRSRGHDPEILRETRRREGLPDDVELLAPPLDPGRVVEAVRSRLPDEDGETPVH